VGPEGKFGVNFAAARKERKRLDIPQVSLVQKENGAHGDETCSFA